MSHLADFTAELKRRRVFRALVGWGIFAFAVLQIYEPVMHGLHLPEWTLTLVVLVLVAGFPATVILAWIFDLSTAGVTRTAPVEPHPDAPPRPPLRGPRLALLLAGLGLVAAAPGVAYLVHRWPGAAPAAPSAAPSVAVLPFVDMSPQRDQDYFSDGIAEEILNALTRVRGLKVIGRTSSFAFKGKTDDLRAIARALSATSLLEGSVRKEGNRVRVTAQLIEASDGTHLWSETFDRELTGTFAIQDEIARAVTEALRLELVPGGSATARGVRKTNPEAHAQYLVGKQLNRSDTADAGRRAVEAFERALALDPSYAPAQAGLSAALQRIYGTSDFASLEEVLQLERRIRLEAERAVALDPGLADGWRVRANARSSYDFDWDGTRADLERARALAPGDADVLAGLAELDATLGRLPEAVAGIRKVNEVDPLNPGHWSGLGLYLLGQGDVAGAQQAFERVLQLDPGAVWSSFWHPTASLVAGRTEEARAAFDRNPSQGLRLTGLAMAQHTLGRKAEARRALDDLVKCCATFDAYQIADVYAWRGEADEALRWLETALVQHDGGITFIKYDPLLKKLRGDPRLAAFLVKLKLPPG
jgi:serine/threonine-protein kinase